MKQFPVPETGTAVLLAGQGTFRERPVAEWYLERMQGWPGRGQDGKSHAISVEEVAGKVLSVFDELRADHGKQGSGILAVVAGYSDGESGPEAWEFTSPLTHDELSPSQTFAVQQILAAPYSETAQAVLGLFGASVDDFDQLTEQGHDPYDTDIWQQKHNLAAQPRADVRLHLTQGLACLIRKQPKQFEADGVGGTWLISDMGPNSQLKTECHRFQNAGA